MRKRKAGGGHGHCKLGDVQIANGHADASGGTGRSAT